jgi:hypothetical protein
MKRSKMTPATVNPATVWTLNADKSYGGTKHVCRARNA